MNDLVKPVGDWISNNVPWAVLIGLFIFCIFFEISKIQIYPLKWLWKAISWPFRKIDEQRTQSFKAIAESIKDDIDTKLEEMKVSSDMNCSIVKGSLDAFETRFATLESRFDALDHMQTQTEERIDSLAAARIKNHVLNFARQCRKGEQHSHEDFRNLFEECKSYEALVEKYHWKNNVYTHDFAYIEHVYDELNKNNGFLGE